MSYLQIKGKENHTQSDLSTRALRNPPGTILATTTLRSSSDLATFPEYRISAAPLSNCSTASNTCLVNSYPKSTVCEPSESSFLFSSCLTQAKKASSAAWDRFCEIKVRSFLRSESWDASSLVVLPALTLPLATPFTGELGTLVIHFSPAAARPIAFAIVDVGGTLMGTTNTLDRYIPFISTNGILGESTKMT